MTRESKRSALWQHVMIGGITLLVGFAIVVALVWDRRPPIEIHAMWVEPEKAHAGDMVIIHKRVEWRRRCAGEIWRQVVGEDQMIRSYAPGWIGAPYSLGPEVDTATIALTPGLPPGKARYRSVITFRQCGLTSWWWSLDIVGLEVDIDIEAPEE